MFEDIIYLVFFALPGATANMAPVIAAKRDWLPSLNRPVDGGQTFRGKRILGDNKTYRGFFVGYLFAQTTVVLQLGLFVQFDVIRNNSLVDYNSINLFLLAVFMSLGALIGDSVKSFFKRQIGIKPGKSWVPFDQADSVLGVLLVSLFYIDLPLRTWLVALIVGTLLHPISTTVAWMLKLKERPI